MLPGLFTMAVLSLLNGLSLLISYVANNSFPQPLNEKEENHYIELAIKGDDSAKKTLVERNLRLVAHIIKKYDGEDFDDLVSIGTIGLIKAVNTYNPGKATRLATYASRCIENEILMYYRSRKKLRSELSIFEPIGSDKDGNELSFIDVLGTDPETVIDTVSGRFENERLWSKLDNLNIQEKRVLILRYGLKGGLSFTQREIAKKLGISRSYVSRIEKKAINRLFDQFAVEGL
ncbi:MAG: RNA polymerase sigma 70 [Peptococcaceae bacterium BICA1-7]|nr:MAG: RNA polymerase sigma 70 [Peptococcaceae bacterium BICA1-7]HBV96707.1 RNA polymerase sporulation sigma factor SigK [Desulfotomaculum sp.]